MNCRSDPRSAVVRDPNHCTRSARTHRYVGRNGVGRGPVRTTTAHCARLAGAGGVRQTLSGLHLMTGRIVRFPHAQVSAGGYPPPGGSP